ncbi:hypothetical protein [Mesorhizobium sp.]|uniref:spike base protein, RCAP_Rcc01079 family n=1 Tax=Mesorhizobium sp. TaxID=1871066 RepID=UPI000FE8B0E1|nr:hypothetical protein [Mesorhizobium sp.]RWI35451.1 MAG: hypothetical protein EOR14_28530 [Mesorhizobium sp.]RWJ66380.1 MAG: hypothetical protein EOR34_28605 [Mesorhizobium sp.]
MPERPVSTPPVLAGGPLSIADIAKSAGYSAPASSQKLVVPNDTADLPSGVCKALEVIAAGDISSIAENDTVAVNRSAVAAGTIIQVRIRRVNATGTTATVVALY